MNNPKISVVMPVYNGERYLAEAIESILNQTFRDYEFIIVYDKSKDNSLQIIKSYIMKDNRIKLIELDNKGLVYSLNTGVDLARGKYIARMDADDISLPERFEVQYNYLEDNPDVDILGAYIEVFGEDEVNKLSMEKRFNEEINENNLYPKLVNGCPIAHPSVMMRSEFAKEKRYNVDYSKMEDYELWVRAYKKGYTIRNVDKVLLRYRLHNDSKSYSEKEELFKYNIEFKLKNFFDLNRKKVLIWGAGLGGRLFVEFVQNSKWKIDIEVIAIIDKEKQGEVNNIEIIKPQDIDRFEYDYIFVTSTLGYWEICKHLDSKGLKVVEDYMSIM